MRVQLRRKRKGFYDFSADRETPSSVVRCRVEEAISLCPRANCMMHGPVDFMGSKSDERN